MYYLDFKKKENQNESGRNDPQKQLRNVLERSTDKSEVRRGRYRLLSKLKFLLHIQSLAPRLSKD